MKKLKTVICSFNSKYIHSSLAPWYLKAGIDKYCNENISAEVFEGTINENINEVFKRLTQEKFDVVGFSCYIWNITMIMEIIPLVKSKYPKCIIILGGPEVSYNAETVLKNNPMVDYVISGEGERPFAFLLNYLQLNDSSIPLDGVCFRNEKGFVISEPYISSEDPPNPYTKEYFSELKGRISYLELSRGCPYSCAFCLSGRCGGVRFFDIERAKKDIIALAKSGSRTVKLVDRTFNANKKRANEIFKFIIDNYGKQIPEGVCFHFEIAGDILNDEIIKTLSAAPKGAIQFEIGLQSFNPETLKAINRVTNVDILKENIKKVVGFRNMHIHIDLIAGLPFENLESFEDSFNTAFYLKPDMLQLGFLKLLHGAEMRENKEKYPCEFLDNPPYEVISTPYISSEEMKCLHCTEDALERLYNSGRFLNTIEYVLNQTKITPFKLFFEFGNFAGDNSKKGISLNDYTDLVFKYFCRLENVDKYQLRDEMLLDRLSANPNGVLPDSLKIHDKAIKKIRMELDGIPNTKRPDGVKRNIGILYSKNKAVYVDYINRDPITGKYPVIEYETDIPIKLNEENEREINDL